MACKLVEINTERKCNFCGFRQNDSLKYGPLYKLKNIVAHYYCVLLSHKMKQNGEDNEGMLGFLLPDIKAELKRSLKVKCIYCGRGNASLKCFKPKCNMKFHLPCGLKNGTLHQFMDEFKSFCPKHKPHQTIPEKILQEAKNCQLLCSICYDSVDFKDMTDTLWAPCCGKTWYHRICVQKLAHSTGYFFKCAICNDTEKFRKWMLKFGIFIPEQDASWELVPNAFEELLFRYSRCDAEECSCPGGRQCDIENTRWEIILCIFCGSQGMHIACGKLKFFKPEWECPTCEKVTKNVQSSAKTEKQSKEKNGNNKQTGIHSKSTEEYVKGLEGSSKDLRKSFEPGRKRKRTTEDTENCVLDKRKKKKIRQGCDPEEIIDVEAMEPDSSENSHKRVDIQEVLSKLKPGPLKYKLELIRNVFGPTCATFTEPYKEEDITEISSSSDVEVTELSDSSDDEGSDVRIIKEKICQYKVNKEVIEISDKKLSGTTKIGSERAPGINNQNVSISENPSGESTSVIIPLADFEIVGALSPVTPCHHIVQLANNIEPVANATYGVTQPQFKVFSCNLPQVRTSENMLPNTSQKGLLGKPTLEPAAAKPIAAVKPQCAVQDKHTTEDPFKDFKTDSEDDLIIIDYDVEKG